MEPFGALHRIDHICALPRTQPDLGSSGDEGFRILEGGARLDRDFGGPVSGAESFVEGNSFRILYVPILQDPGATQDRRFTVEMTGVSAGTELGPTPRVEVTILGGA